jgi:hypothetical protein
MTTGSRTLTETITLSQAKALIRAMAHDQSLLLLSAPGVGKSDLVMQAARDAGLPCRSLLGTQIAPEDVSGIPRIVGERSVFCPPRILLPEEPEPFCLFLDELPACAPDIQKAFYSLLLERRLGEHSLPPGTWVVAAGNRVEDRALVRAMSSALVNRVIILNVRVDVKEWLVWAKANGVRAEIMAFIAFMPGALARPVPAEPVPFSTPRAWASLSRALDLAEQAGVLDGALRRALAFGRVSALDAATFCALTEHQIEPPQSAAAYIRGEAELPTGDAGRWFILNWIRETVVRDVYGWGVRDDSQLKTITPAQVNRFLTSLPQEHRFALLIDLVPKWGMLGADEALFAALREVTGL